MMWIYEKDFATRNWRYVLPVLMLFLSWMMVSEVKYPTFKVLNLRATRPLIWMLIAILFVGSVILLQEKILIFILPFFFTAYLIYGFIRPHIPRKMRHDIQEEEDGQDDATV